MEIFGVKCSKVFVADLQILGGAFCFGIGFIGQRAVSVKGLGPMTCNAIRFGLSAIMLIVARPFLPVMSEKDMSDLSDHDEGSPRESHLNGSGSSSISKPDNKKPVETSTSYVISRLVGPNSIINLAKFQKTIIFWGVFLGIVNFFASGFQQWGITMTSANKVAFIAGFDLFLTPILGLFLPTFKRNGKSVPSTWLAVSISVFGLYLLSDASLTDLTLGQGEFICLISTVFWTLHITYTDIATNYVDTMKMMCVQLVIVSAISTVLALMLEPQAFFWQNFVMFLPWMIFLAISEGLGFTLMAMGQNYSPPTHAAIILSLEGVFASIASYFCLGETLSQKEFIGCCMMLLATLVAKVGCSAIDRGQQGGTVEQRGQDRSGVADIENSSSERKPLISSREKDRENSSSSNNNVNSTKEMINRIFMVMEMIVLPFQQLREVFTQSFTPPSSFTASSANNSNTASTVLLANIHKTPDNVITGSDILLLRSVLGGSSGKEHDSDRDSK